MLRIVLKTLINDLGKKAKNCVGVFIGDFINNKAIMLNISFKGHGNSCTCHLA